MSRKSSVKSKSKSKLNAEAASGWSNDMDDDDDDNGIADRTANSVAFIQRKSRRSGDEVTNGAIPTIPTDDADETTETIVQVATIPTFSVSQIASFAEIEKEFSRERTSQFIDKQIDLGILFHNLNLNENFEDEDEKRWDWDRLYVEIRNSITNTPMNS